MHKLHHIRAKWNRVIYLFCSILYLLSITGIPHVKAASSDEYEALFDQVENMTDDNREDVGNALSTAFFAAPVEFIQALSLEEHSLQDKVERLLNQANISEEGNAEYVQFLLTLFPTVDKSLQANQMNTFIRIFLDAEPDLRNADATFFDALSTAIPYSDGISASQCGHILYCLFLQQPGEVITKISAQDEASQKILITFLHYDSIGRDSAEEYNRLIQSLSADSSLTKAEQDTVSQLVLLSKENREDTPQSTTQAQTADTNSPSNDPPPSGSDNTGWYITTVIILCAAGIAAILLWKKRKN